MTFRGTTRLVATALVAFVAACGAPPATGGTSLPPSSSPIASAIAQSPSPTASATAQPSAPSSTAPATNSYLDDRSNAAALIQSYYNAIGQRQYLRAYSYWEPSDALPPFATFQQGFADTTDVQVELGSVGGNAGAGQLYWSVPAAVLSTTTAGAKSFVGCYTVHLARPELQAAPPFNPMSIQTGQLSAVASAAAARSTLPVACGNANATALPWGNSSGGVDAANYVDDRTAGESVVRSYYNAVNRTEYTRAYSYWEAGASQLPAFAQFQAGYANTKSVTLLTKPGTIGAGAGQTFYTVPAVITASNSDGTTTIFSGCYTLHLGSPNAQATPPFQPLAIQSARVAQAASGSNTSDLLNSACP
jgi:hypothetical protein